MVTVQRSSSSYGPDGGSLNAWSVVGPYRRPADVRPLQGDERFTAPQFVAREQVEFQLRYDDAIADLNPLDRIVYPAMSSSEVDSPLGEIATRRKYDIMAVHEIGRREGLRVIAARQADVIS